MEVIGHGVFVDLGQRPLLGADRPCEVAEVIDGQRQVGGQCLADRLAVVPGLGQRERLEVGFDAVGDLVEDVGAFGGGGLAPRRRGAVGGVESLVDVGVGRTRYLGEWLAGDRRQVLEVLSADRRHPLTADEVSVPRLIRHQGVRGTGAGVNGHQ